MTFAAIKMKNFKQLKICEGYIRLWKLSYKVFKEKCLHTDERGKNADSGVK